MVLGATIGLRHTFGVAFVCGWATTPRMALCHDKDKHLVLVVSRQGQAFGLGLGGTLVCLWRTLEKAGSCPALQFTWRWVKTYGKMLPLIHVIKGVSQATTAPRGVQCIRVWYFL